MPSARGLSPPRIKPLSVMSPALAGWFFTTNTTGEDPIKMLANLVSHEGFVPGLQMTAL